MGYRVGLDILRCYSSLAHAGIRFPDRPARSLVSIHLLVFSPQAGLAGTRTQSGDRYGSGTLHPVHVLRDRLPLLSPAG